MMKIICIFNRTLETTNDNNWPWDQRTEWVSYCAKGQWNFYGFNEKATAADWNKLLETAERCSYYNQGQDKNV